MIDEVKCSFFAKKEPFIKSYDLKCVVTAGPPSEKDGLLLAPSHHQLSNQLISTGSYHKTRPDSCPCAYFPQQNLYERIQTT